MDVELRTLMGPPKTQAPAVLRDRILKAVQDVEAAEVLSEPEPRLAVVSNAVAPPASNWRFMAVAAVLIAIVGGIAYKLERSGELRHVDEAHDLAMAERARESQEVAKLENRVTLPDNDARYTFYNALPAGAVALPSITEAGVEYVPSCESLVTVQITADLPATKPNERDLRRLLPEEVPVTISDTGSPAERSIVAIKRGPFVYHFRMASMEPAACGVVKRYSIQLDLSEIGLEATPAYFESTLQRPITTTVRLRAIR